MAVDTGEPHPFTVRWAFNVDKWAPSDDEWQRLCDALSEEEQVSVRRFFRHVDQRRALVSRYLARRFAVVVLGVPVADVDIRRTAKHGKPYVANPLPVDRRTANFNVSHHGDWVVLVGGVGVLAGVDVTRVEEPRGATTVPQFLDAFRQQLTEHEWDAVTGAPSPLTAFFWHWVLKEAFAKARGDGLIMGLSGVRFSGVRDAVDVIVGAKDTVVTAVTAEAAADDVRVDGCRLELCALDDDHPVAVAWLPLTAAVEPLGSDADAWGPAATPGAAGTVWPAAGRFDELDVAAMFAWWRPP